MVLYVDFDPAQQAFVAVCDDDQVIKLKATDIAAAEAEADELDEGVLWDEC